MKKTLLTTLLATTALAQSSHAATILARWTFETNTPADLSNTVAGPTVAAEQGTGSFQGVHAAAASDWTTPVGNGSANSYSSNEWGTVTPTGNYYQFSTSSVGYTGITISFAHTSSSTGPGQFELQYSTNGTTFTPFASYTVLPNQVAAPGLGSWGGGTEITGYNYSFNLSAQNATLKKQATVYFRLAQNSIADATPPGNVATGGTSRVDNVTVRAIAIPEPSTALLGLASLGLLLRRRRA